MNTDENRGGKRREEDEDTSGSVSSDSKSTNKSLVTKAGGAIASNRLNNNNNNNNNNDDDTKTVSNTRKTFAKRYDSDRQSSDGGGRGQSQRSAYMDRVQGRRRQASSLSSKEPPIDKKTWFDVFISCGLGAISYELGPSFSDPKFRAGFAKKIFIVLTFQQIFIILWMLLLLTRPSFAPFCEERPGLLILAFFVYGLIYCAIRFARCGGEGLCLLGNIITFLFMSFILAYITANIALVFPCWPFILFAVFLTMICITVGSCCPATNILGQLIYGVAFCGGLLNGAGMMAAAYYLEVGPRINNVLMAQYYIPISVLPSIFSLLIVYEVKKLIGGRRTRLNDDQWIIAAVVM